MLYFLRGINIPSTDTVSSSPGSSENQSLSFKMFSHSIFFILHILLCAIFKTGLLIFLHSAIVTFNVAIVKENPYTNPPRFRKNHSRPSSIRIMPKINGRSQISTSVICDVALSTSEI